MIADLEKSSRTFRARVRDNAGREVNDATVTGTVTDAAGVALAADADGGALADDYWPVTFTAAGAGGYFTWTRPANLLKKGRAYFLEVTAVRGGLQRYARIKVYCQTDTD